MDEFNQYFSKEFFIIDSNNLNLIEDKLYGFSFDGEKIIKQDTIGSLTGEGIYVYIENNANSINIFQDFNGSYGLYIFRLNNFFAISNSFLRLVEYLKKDYELTLNEDYAKYFMASGLNSTIYKETLVNEIEIVPRRYVIEIDKITKDIFFKEIDYNEHSIDLNSKKALDILDGWFYKWVNYIRILKQQTNNIQFDLSGGFDSRIMLLLLLSANVDLEKIEIRSFDDGELCHGEDYLIATELADYFNFKLNNKVISTKKINFRDIKTPINISFYTKLGFHNQLNYKFFRTISPVYNFNGLGGENLRDYANFTAGEYLEIYTNIAKRTDNSLERATKRILKTTINKISDEFDIEITSKTIGKIIFNETRSRNHYGKLAVEEFFSNKLLLMPFFDPELHKLKLNVDGCDDDNLLFALIYLRYFPELLNFRFEGNRQINEKTLAIAQKINEISPFFAKNYSFISGPEIDENKLDEYYNMNNKFIKWEIDGFHIKWKDLDDYLREIFNSREFESEFTKYFPISLYNKISQFIDQETYFPLQKAYPVFSVLKIINDVKFSYFKHRFKLTDWFESFNLSNHINDEIINSKMTTFLLMYMTLRIDIKNNFSENNTIEIIENSDKNSTINYPSWYCNDLGKGLVLESTKSKIKIKVKCICDGRLDIIFRGKDVRDKNSNRFPVFIDLTKIFINGKLLLDENKLISHDKPHKFKLDVIDGEIITLEVEWMPFTNLSKYKF